MIWMNEHKTNECFKSLYKVCEANNDTGVLTDDGMKWKWKEKDLSV